jgi:predicted dehydrogenase
MNGVVILGAGKQAEKHARALRAAGVARIAVADVDPERARALAARLGLESIALRAVWDDVAEAVIVATPTPSHAELVGRTLAADKHCLCEKPLAESASDVAVLAEEARRRRLVGMVGYLYRHAPVFAEGHRLSRLALEDPSASPLGPLVHGWFRLAGRGSHRAWKHRREEGGGALREMAVHMLDLLLWYVGPLDDVRFLDRRVLRPRRRIGEQEIVADAEDAVLLCCTDGKGRVFHVACDLLSPGFVQFVELEGERGTFWGSIEPDRPSYVHSLEGGSGYVPGRTSLSPPGEDLYLRQARMFLDAVRSRTPPPVAGFDESVPLHTLLDRLEASAP